MQEIAQIRDCEIKVAKWIVPGEETCQWRFINKYPRLVFELNEECGLKFDLYLRIASLNITHKKVSGGHRRLGVFFISNLDASFTNRRLSILGVTPAVSDILDVKSDIGLKGKRIFIR